MTDTSLHDGSLVLGDVTLSSRLLVGTGKYADNGEMVSALEASGTDCVTVAVRRVDLGGRRRPQPPGCHRPRPLLCAAEHRRLF